MTLFSIFLKLSGNTQLARFLLKIQTDAGVVDEVNARDFGKICEFEFD